MKKALFALAASAALVVPYANAQVGQGTPVFWNGSRLDVSSFVTTLATTGTNTLTPAAGQSVYVAEVHISNCANTSAVAAASVLSLTTTNMGGAAWTLAGGMAAGTCQDIIDTFGGAPLKAAAPGAVTFVNPTFGTNQTIRMSIYWYSAP